MVKRSCMDTGESVTIREKGTPLKEEEQSNEWKIVTSYSLEFMFPRGDPMSGHIAQGH